MPKCSAKGMLISKRKEGVRRKGPEATARLCEEGHQAAAWKKRVCRSLGGREWAKDFFRPVEAQLKPRKGRPVYRKGWLGCRQESANIGLQREPTRASKLLKKGGERGGGSQRLRLAHSEGEQTVKAKKGREILKKKGEKRTLRNLKRKRGNQSGRDWETLNQELE